MSFIKRALDLNPTLKNKSCFLFGPRQTGKTTLIKNSVKPDFYYNLLESNTFLSLNQNPARLRQEVIKPNTLVVIDEIQKIPNLLNEVQLLIEERHIRFLLTGSSARKLRRGGVNLLGGRARHRHMHPLTYHELGKNFDLLKALNRGLIPSIYFSDTPKEDLDSYVGDYLQEEIAHEGLTRNIPAFSRFLEVAALCNSQIINFSNISNDAQVPRTTIYEYFKILKDTLIAHELEPWKKTKKRKPLATSKFYFFDIGITRHLQNSASLHEKSPDFGVAFESYLFHELQTYCDYTQKGKLNYWRSTSDFEVDFILNNEIAIEVKGKENITDRDLSGLKALSEEKLLKKYFLICLAPRERQIGNTLVLPWKTFLDMLWTGDILT